MRDRLRVLSLVIVLAVTAACRGEAPVVRASEVTSTPSASATPTGGGDEARLARLRASEDFDEFAEHERAAKADGARLAWENFAPIVDGERVEWTNKAELWDSIAPKIRDEALLLGPEYRKPLWNTRTAIPASLSIAWNDEDTGGRGHYVEFRAALSGDGGPAERIWGLLIGVGADRRGVISRVMPPITLLEADYASAAEAFENLQERSWAWITSEGAE